KELAQRSAEGVKQPDILWTLNGEKRWAVEVELSAKWGRDFDDFTLKCLRGLHKTSEKAARFDGIFLVTDSPAIHARYTSAFKPGATYNTWEKDDQRRWKVADSHQVPNWIEGRFICQVMN
ncbi:hypothetical protein ACQV5M_20660, partial [Leptospira sp. SA-E8]|uniref:hypothetical protein n=1 Tax=Leptospira sp. SA-E8 TaxID=3422259 RepID=UPI003EC04DAD